MPQRERKGQDRFSLAQMEKTKFKSRTVNTHTIACVKARRCVTNSLTSLLEEDNLRYAMKISKAKD